MRNLLIFIKVLMLWLVIGQTPTTPMTIVKSPTENVQEEIIRLKLENEKAIQEAAAIKAQNREEFEKLKKMEIRKKNLIKSSIEKINKLLKRIKSPPKQESKTLRRSNIGSEEFVNVKIDSICISEKRDDIFSKKKCDKWRVYKYIVDSNNTKIIIQ